MINKIVGAIKDRAGATNTLLNYKYSGTNSTGAETLKNNPNIFKANISYNKNETKLSVHNQTVEKNSLVSGRNMNMKSKNGSISISGTDIKVRNDLDLSAKKDIVVNASEGNYIFTQNRSAIRQRFKKVVKNKLNKDLTIHDLRYSHTSLLINNGV